MSFKIILADQDKPDHVQAIRRLWNDNLRFVAEGRYEWLYRKNPAGPTISCLAIHEESSRIIGMASAMRRNFHFEGKPFRAGIAIDFAIDAEFRVFGPALLLQRTLVEQAWKQGLDFMLGFPNQASQGIVRRVGYEKIGKSIRFSQLIRTRDKLKVLLRDRKLPGAFSVPGAVILDAGLYLKNRLSGSRGSVRTIASEKEFDEQWQDLRQGTAVADVFRGEHGKDYVRWRYLQCPYKDYRLFFLYDEKRLVAFLAYSFRDDGLVLVDDFRFREESWIAPLFQHFWREMRRDGHAVINVGLVVNGDMEKSMTEAGFIARPSERWAGLLPNPNVPMDWQKRLSGGVWYMTDGEIDL